MPEDVKDESTLRASWSVFAAFRNHEIPCLYALFSINEANRLSGFPQENQSFQVMTDLFHRFWDETAAKKEIPNFP